ncbi:hypothetical protein HZS_4599 [Henneguya salminicola]|nr:hypothetical protein HZS_4599 [Henneguya salminicola]
MENSYDCFHISNQDHIELLKNIWIIRKIFLSKEAKIEDKFFNCMKCSNKSVLACLNCAYTCCREHNNHTESHFCFIELTFGQIFCSMCNNFIFISEYVLKNPIGSCLDANSRLILQKYAVEIEDPKRRLGLRGLQNLYNTCFANCIIQAVFHIPIIRNFFLSGVFQCCQTYSDECFMCLLSDLFQKFYDGTNNVVCPHELLGLIWKDSPQFSLSLQQDAHEFFIRFLHLIREYFANQYNSEINHGSVFDSVFFGTIESEIKCRACDSCLSAIVEPFCDLSLEVYSHEDKILGKNSEALIKNGSNQITLEQCLDRFTHIEFLCSEGRRYCECCKSTNDTSKELKILRLPLIFCFHFKRFEHNLTNSLNSTSTKVTCHISFPKQMDMRPYLTRENRQTDEDTKYTLFCVINHQGNLTGGHYTCHITDGLDRWYCCDDTEIYMLTQFCFYVLNYAGWAINLIR